ncbi:Uncharacterised protein [Staphylococcus aureus]|nr:Uncharacterised protein [Staphylococcus aureus]
MKMIIAIVQDQDSQEHLQINLLKITLEQQNWQQQVGF